MHITTLHDIFARLLRYKEKFERGLAQEIQNSSTLVAFMYWALFSFVTSFSQWLNHGYTGHYSALPCWPHFPACKDILPLTPLPYDYSETLFYTLLLSVIVYGGYSLYHARHTTAYYCIFLLWLWKAFVTAVTYGISNFDYYDILLIAVFLCFRNRERYLRLTFVLLYFLASTIKIAPGWIVGTYFTSLATGLPLAGDDLVPFATNAVILMQIVGCWFLLSKNDYLYKGALFYFIFFHLYSTILVGYRYPLTALLSLIVLFGLQERNRTTLRDFVPNLKMVPFLVFVSYLFMLQFVGLLIPGDQKMTLEGNNYGLYMFEANHQCISSHTVIGTDGTESTHVGASADARNRCDPYLYLQRLQKKCTDDVRAISWTFDHSINGGPMYRIVNAENLCPLSYTPFTHNEWIDTDNPPAVAEVHENMYDLGRTAQSTGIFERTEDGVLYRGSKSLENTAITRHTAIQTWLLSHIHTLIALYWTLWVATLLSVVVTISRNKKEQRGTHDERR